MDAVEIHWVQQKSMVDMESQGLLCTSLVVAIGIHWLLWK
jgi:hypothetical protein